MMRFFSHWKQKNIFRKRRWDFRRFWNRAKLLFEKVDDKNPLQSILILVLGLVLLVAILFSGILSPRNTPPLPGKDTISATADQIALLPSDHRMGSRNAKLTIIEYGDIECPFCQQEQPILQKVMQEYGKSGKVAWVWRQFPIEVLHPGAEKKAEASECAAALGGENVFWPFLDKLMQTKENASTDELTQAAADFGISKTDFSSCLQSGKFTAKVKSEFEQGKKLGVNATPSLILLSRNGEIGKVVGVHDFEFWKNLIDQM
ncbi:MAG TPA: thioredoxin domain-containing protein [Candidatus Paceibacterota bacterium]|nr:thioredoxin domain-containing protein [Candidatus Paceibacterota bacterium]